jgi:hypothetical protein
MKLRHACRILVRKPMNAMERKENITMDFRDTGCEDQLWMEMAQDCPSWQALVWVALYLQVPLSQYSFDTLVRTNSIELNKISTHTVNIVCSETWYPSKSYVILLTKSLFLISRGESTASRHFPMRLPYGEFELLTDSYEVIYSL